jgi:hypothetical protein
VSASVHTICSSFIKKRVALRLRFTIDEQCPFASPGELDREITAVVVLPTLPATFTTLIVFILSLTLLCDSLMLLR